ncbi:MAG: hypothetical protein ACK4N5_07035 [Myxococcales bacterium]
MAEDNKGVGELGMGYGKDAGQPSGEPDIEKKSGEGPNASTEGRDMGWSDTWAGRTGIPEGARDRSTSGELYETVDHQPSPER